MRVRSLDFTRVEPEPEAASTSPGRLADVNLARMMLIALTVLAMFGRSPVEACPGVVVPSVVYNGYFVSNEFEPKVADSFIVIKDRAAFDRVFGVAAVMFDRSHRLQANTFRNQW